MIVSIRHKGLKLLWQKGDVSRLPAQYVQRIRLILALLNAVERPDEINIPFGNVHPLKGDLQGYLSISVSRNWRLIFQVDEAGNVHDVDLIDYH